MAVADQERGAAGDDAGLAGACTRKDQQRPLDVEDRLALFGVERFQELHFRQGLGTRGWRLEQNDSA